MFLLRSTTSPNPEFASLTLLLNNENGPAYMGEPLTLAGPLSTMDPTVVGKAVSELNEYLHSVYKIGTKDTDNASMTSRVSAEDSILWDDVQVFRPSGCYGIGMYYFVLRTGPSVRKCASIVLHTSSSNKGSSVVAVVLCVGFSGLAYAQASSPLQYSLYSRMRDCMGVISKIGSSSTTDAKERQAAAKALMSTLLLTEDDLRKTSTMVVAEQSVMIPEAQVSGTDGTLERISSTLMTPINVVQQGGLNVVQGGLNVVHGGLFVVQGGLHVVSGGINAVTGGVLKTSTVQGGINAVSGGISSIAGGVSSTGGMLMRTNLLKSIKSRTMSKKDIDITDLRLESESNASSADVARVLSERLAVISVVEKETILRRFEVVEQVMSRRSSMGAPPPGKVVKRVPRRRKGEKKCADLNDFDYFAPLSVAAKSVQSEVDESRTRKSFTSPGLRPPGSDTSPKPAKRSSVPMLMAPRNDKGSSRRAAQPLKRKSSARNILEEKDTPKNDFSSFDVFENDPEDENQAIHFPSDNGGNGVHDAWGQRASGGGVDKSSDGFDPFSDLSGYSKAPSVNGEGTVTTVGSTHSGMSSSNTGRRSRGGEEIDLTRPPGDFPGLPGQHLPFYASRPDGADARGNSDRLEDLYESFRNSNWASTGPDDDELIPQEHGNTPLGSRVQVVPGSGNGNELKPNVQVNIALNEDLTCSYKQSKMASCTIEGVVQVQVKSEARVGAPFFLYLSDPRGHIGALQENRKYADDMSESLDDESNADHKFTVSVPKADNYFPIMRYKCSNELRPVPIRVQTRVRLNGGFCRVALQISSNPANHDNLTDLTIIMGVPPDIRGETLTTSPSGGVWNASKRSVIWCVAELGHGEKFQLQAQFEVDPDRVAELEKEKPSFPVLVRCQCMYAQLSDIRLHATDIPEVFPADVSMKLARRFRLSHRERS